MRQLVEIYKAQSAEKRQHLRNRAAYLANSPAADALQRQTNTQLLKELEQAEKELIPVSPVQKIEIQLPDISGETVIRLGKYAAIAGGGYVGLYAIGAAAVGIGAAITAFFATYGVYLVGAGIGVVLLRSIKWRRDEDGGTVTERFEQETFYQKTFYEKTTEQ